MDRGAWRATVHEIAELDMTEATEHACRDPEGLSYVDDLHHLFAALFLFQDPHTFSLCLISDSLRGHSYLFSLGLCISALLLT